MDDLLREFLTESGESLTEIDVQLVKFEQEPNNAQILQNIFRLMHTIKGTSGFLGLPRLESVAHAGEDVLGKFRDGELEVTPKAVTLILRCIDTIRGVLDGLEASGREPEGDDTQLINELHAMAEGRAQAAVAPAAETSVDAIADASAPTTVPESFPVAQELLDEIAAFAAEETKASEPTPCASAPAAAGTKPSAASTPSAAVLPAVENKPVATSSPGGNGKSPAKNTPAAPATAAGDAAAKSAAAAAASIRVNVELLENLMTLVSEMVLTRNQLMQMIRGKDNDEFVAPLQRLSLLTTDLQEGVMKTRMQPIGNAWAKLPRIVRDLAVESGKKVDLQMIGEETELDRQVLEMIKDPLTHMVRNSADHGLESPAERRAAGKPETGVIKLNAYHEGGHIIIEISDDGRGLNTDRIREKVVEKGLATSVELDAMSEQQIQQFIFKPGFSTAEKVTNVSGRGVGMDVVRTNIEKIGGAIELKSLQGRGSIFIIKIPLTLAIVSALIVRCATERFAIPQIGVHELVRAKPGGNHSIEMINQSPVLRLRDRLLPLVSLRNLLNLNDGKLQTFEREVFIVVAQVGTFSFGVIVDHIFDTEEIVVKPVSPILRTLPFYSGNTILGDGSVIMILDLNGIASSIGDSVAGPEATIEDAAAAQEEDRTTLLIFRAGNESMKAVPLGLVARIEEIEIGKIERVNGQHVTQYRGRLMPLIPCDPGHQWKTQGRQPILVFSDHERSMGLVVDQILDTVEDRLNMQLSANQPGLVGSTIVDGKATDVIDVGHYLTQAFSDWFKEGSGETTRRAKGNGKRVLLVDDSSFFRELIWPHLAVAGYRVTTAESADSALKLRDAGKKFDLIISDIEMPGMNGYDFVKAVRSDSRWESVPMVALSSSIPEEPNGGDAENGFCTYVSKTKREDLLRSLSEAMTSLGGHA